MNDALPKSLPLDILEQGQVIHRIASANYAADAFNRYPWIHYVNEVPHKMTEKPSTGTNIPTPEFCHRFSPFTVDSKTTVATMYAGLTEHAAVVETVMRPSEKHTNYLSLNSLNDLIMVQLKIKEKIRLAACYSPPHFDPLAEFNPAFKVHVEPNLSGYHQSELFAKALYRHTDKIDGIIWYSTQDHHHTSLVLFDRAENKISIDGDKPVEALLKSDRLLATIGRLSTKFNRVLDSDLVTRIQNTGLMPTF